MDISSLTAAFEHAEIVVGNVRNDPGYLNNELYKAYYGICRA